MQHHRAGGEGVARQADQRRDFLQLAQHDLVRAHDVEEQPQRVRGDDAPHEPDVQVELEDGVRAANVALQGEDLDAGGEAEAEGGERVDEQHDGRERGRRAEFAPHAERNANDGDEGDRSRARAVRRGDRRDGNRQQDERAEQQQHLRLPRPL